VQFSNDQFARAHRSYDLRVGAKPIYCKHLNADKLATAIQYALTDTIINNAQKLGRNIGTENGARAGAKIIADYLAGSLYKKTTMSFFC
jgi:sterol 3beta-glucosyltransferase